MGWPVERPFKISGIITILSKVKKAILWLVRGVTVITVVISMYLAFQLIVNNVLPDIGMWEVTLVVLLPVGIACWIFIFTIVFFWLAYILGIPAFFRKP